jgi:hypothetical protein
MSVKIRVKCSCGGDIVAGPGDFTCLGCGKEWAKPHELQAFYQEYRELIQIDLRNNGDLWVTEHWGISKRSLGQLKKSWDGLAQAEPEPEPVLLSNVVLPVLPAFSEKMDYRVQLKWLEVYVTLAVNKQ